MLHTEWDHPRKKAEHFYLNLARSREGCDARCDVPVIWWGQGAIGFLDKINLVFFFFWFFYVFFAGNVAVSVWLASVWMNQLWLLWLNEGYEWLYGPYLHDYHLYYTHQCVITDILTAIGVHVWQSEYVREYVLHTKLFFLSFFVLLTFFLVYVLVVK